MSVTEFGGVGDGKSSNTDAFRRAIDYLKRFAGEGGAQLNIPRGIWVTGSFNLTSNFTLFLEEGSVILGSQVRVHRNFTKLMVYDEKLRIAYHLDVSVSTSVDE